MSLALSEFKAPKASVPFKYCEIFPGNIKMKNKANASPTFTRCFVQKTIPRPNKISIIPDKITTKSLLNGIQSGTCA